MVFFLIFTILYHFSLNAALDPLLYSLPKSLEAEEESLVAALEAGTRNGSEDIKEKGSGEVSTSTPAPVKKPNMFSKFFAPHIYSDYATLRQLVPHGLLDANNMYEELVAENAYYPPSVTAELPLLWIPRDEMGVSAQEVQHTSKILPITDEGVTLNEKNKLVWDAEGARPPLWTPKVYY
jgi:hypothetical protein